MSLQSQNIFLPADKPINNATFFYTHLPEINELGYLIFGVDTYLPLSQYHTIINLLNSLSDNYFLRQDIADPLGCFEKVINQFNLEFFQNFLEQISWSRKINITLALLVDQKLHFANYGNNHLLLLKQKNYIDIIRQVSTNLHLSSKKIFDQIYSGDINQFNRLALCNQAVLDYISSEKIKNIFNILPIQNIPEQLIQLTKQTFRNQNMSGIIILNPEFKTINNDLGEKKVFLTDDTIKNLQIKTAETQKYLHPKYLPDIEQIKQKFLKLLPKTKNQLVYQKENKNISGFKNYLNKFRGLPANVSFLNRKYKHQILDLGQFLKNAPVDLLFSLKQLHLKIKSLSKLSKFLLAASLILIFSLLFNLSVLGIKKNTNISTEYFNQTVNQIQALQSEAQAAIIYGDNQKAKQVLNQALNLTYNLPKNNSEREKINFDLLQKNEQLLNEANRLIVLSSLSPLISIDSITNENPIRNSLYINGNNLFFLTNNSLFKINLNDRAITKLDLPDQKPELLITEKENLFVFFSENKTFYRLDVDSNEWQNTLLPWTENKPPSSGGIYNNNIYLSTADDNKILRYNNIGNSFTGPQIWLEPNKISEISSLSIDGSIYTLQTNGQIYKFTRGEQQIFSVEPIEPNIKSGGQIITNNDLTVIYILDPSNKRLVIINKEGKLVQQYKSDVFSNLEAVAVSQKKENNKRIIYLFAEKNIYELLVAE